MIDVSYEELAEYRARLVEQPALDPSTTAAELPKQIVRKCCPYKSCGNTDLYLDSRLHRDEGGQAVDLYGYRRQSNDNWYFHPTDLPGLIACLSNDEYWPVKK